MRYVQMSFDELKVANRLFSNVETIKNPVIYYILEKKIYILRII